MRNALLEERAYVTTNSRPIDDMIYSLLVVDGHLNPVVPVYGAVAASDRASALGAAFTQGGRGFRVGIELRPETVVDRLTAIRKIRERFRGVQEIATSDAPDQVFYGVLADVKVELYTAIYANSIAYVECLFRCDDPVHYDLDPYTRALSSTPVACPVGSAVSAPVIYLFGGATPVVNPQIILSNHVGDELARLVLTGSLGSTSALRIDTALQTMDLTIAGVLQTGTASGLAWLTSGAFPELSPEDAAPESDAHPRVALTAASGTPTGLLLAQRSYN